MSDATANLARACVENPEHYSETWHLDCPNCYRRMATVYAELPTGMLVLWLAGERGTMNRLDDEPGRPIRLARRPPSAIYMPVNEHDPVQPQTAICPRCRRGKLLLPLPAKVRILGSIETAGFGRVASDNADPSGA